jgi:hypothetical protein
LLSFKHPVKKRSTSIQKQTILSGYEQRRHERIKIEVQVVPFNTVIAT